MKDSGPTSDSPPRVPSVATDAAAVSVSSLVPVDRRRSVRAEPAAFSQAELSTVADIEVLDLSETGVLLACNCALEVGHRGQLRILLARQPFVAWIEVARVAQAASGLPSKHFLLGAVFTSIDEHSAAVLRAFLPQRDGRSRLG